MLDEDVVLVLLRTRYDLLSSEYPVCLGDGVPQEWVSSDIDISRLVYRAKADALSYSDCHEADYSIGLLVGGAVLNIGEAIADCERPPTRECQVCHRSEDARLFLHTTREDIDGASHASYSGLCRQCKSFKQRVRVYATDKEVKRERQHQLVRDLLTQQPWYSNVKIAELARAGGYPKCGDGIVGKIRHQLETEGLVKPQTMRVATDGFVRRADYQANTGQGRG